MKIEIPFRDKPEVARLWYCEFCQAFGRKSLHKKPVKMIRIKTGYDPIPICRQCLTNMLSLLKRPT